METEKNEVNVNNQMDEKTLRQIRIRAEAQFSVLVHLVAYIAVNLILFLINLGTFAGTWWVLWPIFGWGTGLFFHAVAAFTIPGISSIRRRLYHQEMERMRQKP